MELQDGSRVAVVGGGPAGSFASYFLLDLAERVGLKLAVDIYEPKDFKACGPAGCNNCGGIISESLVQLLASEGINLPDTVVQRAIDAYVLHTDVGSVRIDTPLHEMRIAAVHRGSGPSGTKGRRWDSFDGYLLDLVARKGATVEHRRVDRLDWDEGRPRVHGRGAEPRRYDLLIGAVGLNSTALELFRGMGVQFAPPRTARTLICEYALGEELVTRHFGSAMHVFLIDIPGLEFAALIPKGEHVTLCLLGHNVGNELLARFLAAPEVAACFPPGWEKPVAACHCAPHINVGPARHPFGDRVVLVGDSSVARLYKDGIGAAYRTGKASALAAVFRGISDPDFRRHYQPACRAIVRDNRLGKLVFGGASFARRLKPMRRALVEMVRHEQGLPGAERDLSHILWDTFTGSAPYREVFQRASRPGFLARFGARTVRALFTREARAPHPA